VTYKKFIQSLLVEDTPQDAFKNAKQHFLKKLQNSRTVDNYTCTWFGCPVP